jgi:hypothetical protein
MEQSMGIWKGLIEYPIKLYKNLVQGVKRHWRV